MDDLISRKALLKELRRELRECRKDGEEFGGESILLAEGIESAIDTIKYTPTVDAVEVVRCKDCKWSVMDAPDFPYQYLCSLEGGFWNKGSHFCSYGERKEKDDGNAT